MIDKILASLKENQKALSELVKAEHTHKSILRIAKEIAQCFENEGKLLICGNGGSAADSIHFAEELVGRFRKDRVALPALALTDPAFLTCVANDYGFEHVFSRGVEAFGKSGDILIGISTSGNSDNVVLAAGKARELNMKVFGLLGRDGGELKKFCDQSLIVPANKTDRIQEIHGLMIHIIIEMVERIMFPENYRD